MKKFQITSYRPLSLPPINSVFRAISKVYLSTSVRQFLLSATLIASLPSHPLLAANTESGPIEADVVTTTADSLLPLDEVRIFTEVLNQIRTSYIEPIDDKALLENAIKGMLNGIDPHSTYLADQDFDNLQESTTGEFGGLGVEVSTENGYIKVITPMDDSPAATAGVEAGDLIIKLDEIPAREITLGDTVNIMRGEPGTDITLTIVRDGVDEPFEIVVTRAIISARSVRSRTLEDGYGYIRIAQFAAKTAEEVEEEINKLHTDNVDLKGLVLDLRNNPGGVLQASVDVVDSFITEGLIVYTEGRIDSAEMRFEATNRDPSKEVPLVVLINEGSASASEIVAGAIQDHHRGLIMGTKSFGKGSVQTVLPLTNDRAIKLTTALYFTPSGRSIQATGIIPDIEVSRGQVTALPNSLATYREKDLINHLANGNSDKSEPLTEAPVNSKLEVIVSDYQLNEALNVLKGMNLLKRQASPFPLQAVNAGEESEG